MAVGLDTSRAGDDAFKQPFDLGTNILAKIPGGDLANEYVIIGGHYDHLGNNCRGTDATDTVCNGATDNGTGTAAVLELARKIKAAGTPRRTVVFALWDREEDGLLGSNFYVQNPIVPIAQTVGVHQLRHPGLEPPPQPPEHELRRGRGDRWRADAVRGEERSRDGQAPDPPAQRDLRSGSQRLRELHQRRCAERLLLATRPDPATTRRRTS